MPEQISKYPEVTLKVLQVAGASCGERVKPKILTQCPPERFCSLPTAEICVYEITDIPRMTQTTPEELAQVVCPPGKAAEASLASVSSFDSILMGATFLVGFVIGGLGRRGMTRTQRGHRRSNVCALKTSRP
jgi:hypothetical protein